MKEAMCKNCGAVYTTDGVIDGFICFCESNKFEVKEIEKVKEAKEEAGDEDK